MHRRLLLALPFFALTALVSACAAPVTTEAPAGHDVTDDKSEATAVAIALNTPAGRSLVTSAVRVPWGAAYGPGIPYLVEWLAVASAGAQQRAYADAVDILEGSPVEEAYWTVSLGGYSFHWWGRAELTPTEERAAITAVRNLCALSRTSSSQAAAIHCANGEISGPTGYSLASSRSAGSCTLDCSASFGPDYVLSVPCDSAICVDAALSNCTCN